VEETGSSKEYSMEFFGAIKRKPSIKPGFLVIKPKVLLTKGLFKNFRN
jgi:hypothetical protein